MFEVLRLVVTVVSCDLIELILIGASSISANLLVFISESICRIVCIAGHRVLGNLLNDHVVRSRPHFLLLLAVRELVTPHCHGDAPFHVGRYAFMVATSHRLFKHSIGTSGWLVSELNLEVWQILR